MDEKVFRVIKGYTELDYSQRIDAMEKMKEYDSSDFDKRKPLLESLQKSLGPTSQKTCPCCGR